MKYTKKPVEIEAVQFVVTKVIPCRYGDAREYNTIEICKFMKLPMMGMHTDKVGAHIIITTLEGDMRADVGDYIIKGVKGEFYPCKPDIFDLTYDKSPDRKRRTPLKADGRYHQGR